MYHHPSLISSPWPFDGAGHNSLRVVDIVVSRQPTLYTGCSILLFQVFSRSVGEPVDPICFWSTRHSYLHPQTWIEIWMDRRIVPISLPQPAIRGLLNFFLKNYHMQFKKIITYKIKWMNEHTTKCWARLSTNCCTPFWRSWLRTCISANSSIGLGSRPRDAACKEKIGCKLNIL
jgi:hypothetical protein